MGNKPTIRVYQNCDEIPAYNFFEINKTKDFKWLVYGYDGWGDVELTDDIEDVWSDITNEYSGLVKNNKTIGYFEKVVDLSDLTVRFEMGKTLIEQLAERPLMSDDTKKLYITELRHWRFYINESNALLDEVNKVIKQLKAIRMKIQLLNSEVSKYEESKGETDIMKIKVAVQNVIKRDIDLKKISIKEWIYTLESLPKTKAA